MKKLNLMLLALFFLAACGNNENDNKNSNEENESSNVSTETEYDPTNQPEYAEASSDGTLQEYTEKITTSINELNNLVENDDLSEDDEKLKEYITNNLNSLTDAQESIKNVSTKSNEIQKELMRVTETYIIGYKEFLKVIEVENEKNIDEDDPVINNIMLYFYHVLGINEIGFAQVSDNIDFVDKGILDDLITERAANDFIDAIYRPYVSDIANDYSEFIGEEYVNAVNGGFIPSEKLFKELYNEEYFLNIYYKTGLNDGTKDISKKQANEAISKFNEIAPNVIQLPEVDDAITTSLYNVIVTYLNNFGSATRELNE